MGLKLKRPRRKKKKPKVAEPTIDEEIEDDIVNNVPSRPKGQRLSMRIIDAVFSLYARDIPLKEISERTGVSVPSIAKYISHGDPKRSIQPLSERRANVFRAAMALQDGRIVESIRSQQAVSAAAMGAVSRRYLKRVAAADELDDPTLYAKGNELRRMIVEQKALEPNTGDFKTVLNAHAETLRLASQAVEHGDERAGISIHVNQQQSGASSSSESHVDNQSITAAQAHIENLKKMGDADRAAVDRLVKKIGLSIESREDFLEVPSLPDKGSVGGKDYGTEVETSEAARVRKITSPKGEILVATGEEEEDDDD